jgi:predicted nucleotide-binding protein
LAASPYDAPVTGRLPAVFIGSSSEGLDYARYLQVELQDDCDVKIWNQGVFGLSGDTLTSLVQEADRVDVAVLVLTPDDLTIKREKELRSARDNVIFEAGMFIGALGAPRTILVHAKDLGLDLPSDLVGTTTCTFRSQRADNSKRAAIGPAATEIREVIRRLGRRKQTTPGDLEAVPVASSLSIEDEKRELDRELDVLTNAVTAHGWQLKTRSVLRFA